MRLALLLLCSLSAFGGTTKTVVSTVIYDGAGNLANGIILVTPNKMWTAQDGETVFPKTTVSPVTSGVLSISLYPNDLGSPSDSFYTVEYNIAGGGRYYQYWRVPTTGSAIAPPIVSVPPVGSGSISLSQLLRGGANFGQSVVWGGSSWGPGVEGICGTFSSATTVTFTHNLGSLNVIPIIKVSNVVVEPKGWTASSTSVVVVTFDAATSGTICVK